MTATSPPIIPVPASRISAPEIRKRIKIAAAVVVALRAPGRRLCGRRSRRPVPDPRLPTTDRAGEPHLKAEQLKLSNEKATMQAEQGQVRTAQAAAKNAMTTALAQVRAQYKSKLASVQSLSANSSRSRAIVLSSTISADGVYVVGKDIPSGTYHTSGGNQCYLRDTGEH